MMADWTTFLPFLAAVFVVALSGAIFMPGPWYKTLEKPSWTPPDWLFAPAWLVLYVAIAVAGWRVWQADGIGLALGVWGLNLVFNAAWSWLMFGRRQIGLALADALAMLATIIAFMALAWPISQQATWLFAPYLAWVAFASLLNWAILRRNPGASDVTRTA
ncbi:MAG: TspO/MBR family protein [Hyphomicrobiaceae bacterium]|nr:TspO/MBR family protein [Hyphomicrobiaceae bacterium]